MPEHPKQPAGTIAWRDLTVADAESTKQFYSAVVGWEAADLNMGDYNDFVMKSPETGEAVVGICHARGSNAKLPPQWLMYVTVEKVDACAMLAVERGGKVLDGPRMMGGHQFCVIQDPAGAVIGLISP